MSPPAETPRALNTPPEPPPVSRSDRWRGRLVVVLVIASGVAVAGWRQRVTRPEYRVARGHEAIANRDWDRADYYASRLEASGHPDRARLLRGESLLARRRPDLALAEFNRIRGEGEVRLQAAALSGKCLLDLGDLREAHRVLSFVASERPDHVDAHRGLAAVAYDLGQLGAAVDHLEQVGRLDPQDARPCRLVGLIYKDMGQLDKATVAYEEALRRGLPPAVESEVRFELAEALTQQARFADALRLLGAATPDAPEKDPARLAVRAECLRGVGRSAEAVALLDRGTGESGPVLRLRGQLLLDAGDQQAAVRPLERAVELAPTDYQSHYLLAKVYAGLGRTSDAKREFDRVEGLRRALDRMTALSREAMEKPWESGVRLQLAELSEQLGRPQLAEMWRSAAAACEARKP